MDSDGRHRVLDLCGQGGDVKGHPHPSDNDHKVSRQTKQQMAPKCEHSTLVGDDDLIPDCWESIISDEFESEYGSDSCIDAIITLDPKLGVACFSQNKAEHTTGVSIDEEYGKQQQQEQGDVQQVCGTFKSGLFEEMEHQQQCCGSTDSVQEMTKTVCHHLPARCHLTATLSSPLTAEGNVHHELSAACWVSEDGDEKSKNTGISSQSAGVTITQVTTGQHNEPVRLDIHLCVAGQSSAVNVTPDSSTAMVFTERMKSEMPNQQLSVHHPGIQTCHDGLHENIASSTCCDKVCSDKDSSRVIAQADGDSGEELVRDDDSTNWEVPAVMPLLTVSNLCCPDVNTDSEVDEFFSLDEDSGGDDTSGDRCDIRAVCQVTTSRSSPVPVLSTSVAAALYTMVSTVIQPNSLPVYGHSQMSDESSCITVHTTSCIVSSSIRNCGKPAVSKYGEKSKVANTCDVQTHVMSPGRQDESLPRSDHPSRTGDLVMVGDSVCTLMTASEQRHGQTPASGKDSTKDGSSSQMDGICVGQSNQVIFVDTEVEGERHSDVGHMICTSPSSGSECEAVIQNKTTTARIVTAQNDESTIRDCLDSDKRVFKSYQNFENWTCLECTSSEPAQSTTVTAVDAPAEHDDDDDDDELCGARNEVFIDAKASLMSHRRLPCTVMVTDVDTNITNVLDLETLSDYGGNNSGASSRSNLNVCARSYNSADERALVTESSLLSPVTPDGSIDEEANEDMESDGLPFCEVDEYSPGALYDDYVSYQMEGMFGETVVTSGDTITESTVVYTDSTVVGIDTLMYGESSVPVLTTQSYMDDYNIGYSSDTKSCSNSDQRSIAGQGCGSVMVTPVGMPTCPHGYPAVPNTPVMVHTSEMSMCSPSPDSSLLAGVYSTIAPLRCTLTPDCPIMRLSDAKDESAPEEHVSSSRAEADVTGQMTGNDDYLDLSPPLECSGYTTLTSANSHISMATIPNTTATIPAVITATSVPDCDAIASPTTSLQFRVQLKELAFVGSCLKIAAKVSVTEEDAEFWKHMHPGDVYFFSANSYVLCVQHNKQKVSAKAPGLNPNANVFHIKNPANVTTPPSECGSADWPTPDTSSVSNVQSPASEEFVYMNGDVGKTPPPGVITTTFPPTPESPMSVGQADFSSVNGVVEGQALFPSDGGQDELPLDSNITDDQRREMIKSQLEYYFSRENLANDSYLVSQMDADQYVSIATIASFNQVKRLTNDLELVIKILRESVNVQVDEKGEKVRPLHKRCIVILREIPDTTPVEAIKKLFMGENCPPFTSCEFAHNDSWYVTFESEEDAQKAYRYLREEVCTFLGKPIMARIKAKPLLHNTFVPKNGFKQSYDPPVYSQPQKFTQYPTVSYVPNQQGYPFFPPGGPAAAAAGTPTPPSASSIPQVWPTSPATLSYFDPGTAFAANGYTPSTTIKIPASRQQTFNSVRHNRNQKPHRGGTPGNREHAGLSHSDRSNDHERSEHRDLQRDRNTQSRDAPRADRYSDRHVAGVNRTFKSDGVSIVNNYHNHHHHSSNLVNFNRGSDGRNYHGHHHPSSLQAGQSHTHSHTHQHSSHTSADKDHEPIISSNSRHSSTSEVNNKDQYPQPQRRGAGYRSKRRPRGSDDNGANRSTSSCQQAKEKQCCEPPNFDLADTSFPPLPGSTSNTSSSEVFENKMSDVVKGTAKPSKPASTPAMPCITVATTAVSASQPLHTSQASLSSTPAPAVPANKEVVKSVPVSQANPSSKPCTTVAKSNTTTMKTSSNLAKPNVIQTTTTQSSTITMASVVTNSTTGAAATPTQKVSKATCTDGAVMTVDMTSVSATASTSTQTCSNGATSITSAASTQDEKTPKKLSYAEMAQRGKAQVVKAAEKIKTDDGSSKDQPANGVTSSTSSETKESVTLSVTVSAAVATASTGTRSPTHRDQTRDQCAYGARRTYNNTRREEHKKDRSGYYRTDRRSNRENERSRVK